ncbi:MAG: DUF1036 domain-containing protein [Rhodobacter sp.]|nr:DUF1036 domain-containing protein [Rhodobacter sp.]
MLGRIAPALAGAAVLAALAAPALAGLEICNETDLQQSVAIGYKGDRDWTSEGWWNIDPGDCALVVDGDLKQRYYYYRAESDGREFQGQRYVFCTQTEVFTIVGDTDCEDRGFAAQEFREIDTGATATKFTLSLVDTGGGSQPTTKIGGKSGPASGTATIETPPPGPRIVSDDTQSLTQPPPETLPVTVSLEDLSSGMAPGHHGDAFTTDALFQGCEIEDGREYCGFHAGEWKLRAFHKGPTPNELLYALEGMAVNSPVEIEGDVVEAAGNQMAVVVREVRPKPGADRDSQLRAALQGDWVDSGDAGAEITVRGSEIYRRSEGTFAGAAFWRIARTCDPAGGKGPVILQTEAGGGRTACFVITAADGRRLELADPRHGGALRYRRP